MKKSLAILLPAFLLVMSCTKTETKSQCATGTINVNNLSKFPFTMTVDDREPVELAGKSNTNNEYFSGKYFVRIEQKEGFAVSPAMQEQYVDVKGCETVYLTIPKTNNPEEDK